MAQQQEEGQPGTMQRREFLGASTRPRHISSLVVHCRPGVLASAISTIEALPGLEVPRSDAGGKFVVLLETDNESDIMQRIATIEALPGVINVTLAYHQIDD